MGCCWQYVRRGMKTVVGEYSIFLLSFVFLWFACAWGMSMGHHGAPRLSPKLYLTHSVLLFSV